MRIETFYLSTVFIAGVLSFFSPCIVPLLPVYFSIFTAGGREGDGGGKRRHQLWKSVLFVAGLSANFILLGFGAGALGAVIGTSQFMMAVGLVVIILGFHQTGLIKIRPLMSQRKVEFKRSGKNDVLGVFLLGFTFSFGWTPCIGPVLGAILGLAANGNRPLYGGIMMGVYSLGFLIPFLILALFSDVLLKKVRFLNRHLDKIKVVGGIIIIMMGVLLMTDNLNLITASLF